MSRGSRPAGDRSAPRRYTEADAPLREALRRSGMEGKPLHVSSVPYSVNPTALIGGMMGPPAWSVRLKRIHDGRCALKAKLDAAWGEMAERFRDQPERFTASWRGYVAGLDLSMLNTLIQKHNDYYLIEARIPVIYPTGDYLIPPGIEYPQKLVTGDQLLEEYPADVDMALYFSE